jgi:hypothetical protein
MPEPQDAAKELAAVMPPRVLDALVPSTMPNVQDAIDKSPMVAPNVMHRVQGGCNGDFCEDAIKQVVKATDSPWLINGQVVVMAKLDQQTMSRMWTRREAGTHEH